MSGNPIPTRSAAYPWQIPVVRHHRVFLSRLRTHGWQCRNPSSLFGRYDFIRFSDVNIDLPD